MRCRHCGGPKPDVVHLFARGPAPALQVGSIVVARKATDACHLGEAGVVCEEYLLHDRTGWGIIFEGGRHEGFNACEVDWLLTVTGEVCKEVAGYAFENARRLAEDFGSGRFAPASRMAKAGAAGPAFQAAASP